MKYMAKIIAVLMALMLIFVAIPAYAQAASLKEASFKLVNKTDTTVQVSITKVDSAKGYGIYQKVDGKWKRIASTTNTKYTVKNLEPSTKYTFTVRAYKVVDGVKKYSTNYNKTGKSVTTWKKGRVANCIPGEYLKDDGEFILSIESKSGTLSGKIWCNPKSEGIEATFYGINSYRGYAERGGMKVIFFEDGFEIVKMPDEDSDFLEGVYRKPYKG